MEQRVSLITLGVADLVRSRNFYETGLGWRVGFANEEVVFFQLIGAVLALFRRTDLAKDAGLAVEAVGAGGVALAHNVRSRDQVEAVLREAAAAGGRILKPAHDASWGGYSGYFSDPDGHPWEVAWNPHWTLEPDGGIRLKT
ncbi:MAG: VOC family protein [Pirellulales bacterium]